MKQNKLKVISAKDLGRLNMPDFCPRCFWLERHIDKPPSIFPGIFSTLDAITKRSTHRSFLERNKIPDWLKIEDLIEVEQGSSYFKILTEQGDWTLTGLPDDIFKTKDDNYHIVDYKVAKFTAQQDHLYPLYKVQLNSYAYLAEKYGFKPVTKLTLIYCQPNKDLENDEDFKLGFETHTLEVDLDLSIIPELLLEARKILDQKEPPQSYEECKGICQWIDKVFDRISF